MTHVVGETPAHLAHESGHQAEHRQVTFFEHNYSAFWEVSDLVHWGRIWTPGATAIDSYCITKMFGVPGDTLAALWADTNTVATSPS